MGGDKCSTDWLHRHLVSGIRDHVWKGTIGGTRVQDLSIEDFTCWLGEGCRVASGDLLLEMTLEQAQPLEGGVREAGAFRLEFLGPSSPVLAQGIMTVERAACAYEIFLVPTSSDATGSRYEAVFY